jgi:hypothetical protein
MSPPINMALYRLLLKVGASEAEAEQAAQFDASELATKADLLALKTDLLKVQADLQKFIIQAMLGMTAIFAIIVGLFRVFA